MRIQLSNIRRRLELIRWMQLLGAISLFFCVISMLAIMRGFQPVAQCCFFAAVALMSLSLAALMIEILISGGALKILLKRMESEDR